MASPSRLTPLAALFIAGTALAGPAPQQPDTTNAALRYWKVWATVTPEAIQSVQNVKPDDLTSPAWTPDPALSQAIAAFNFATFIKASRMPECDFGLDTADDGPLVLMPHLGPMRATIKAMVIDARARLDAGDLDGAVERLAAGYRAAQHISREPVLISGLVAAASFRMVDQMAAYALANAALTPDHRAALRDALAGFDAADPFSLRADVETERRDFVGWLSRIIENGNNAEFETALGSLGLPDDAKVRARQWMTDKDAARRHLQLVDQYYQFALRIWDQPDAPDAIKTLVDKADKGEFGDIASFFAPAFDSIHRQYRQSQAAIAAARERLDR